MCILTTKLADCLVGFELYSQLQLSILKRFRGVVGYHIRLTRGRSPVRTRTKTDSFFSFFRKEKYVVNCPCHMSITATFFKQQPQQSKEKLSFVKPKKIVLTFATMMM